MCVGGDRIVEGGRAVRNRGAGRIAALAMLLGLVAGAGFVAQAAVVGGARQDDATEVTVAIDLPGDGAEVAGPGVLVQWTAPETTEDGADLHVDLIVDDGAQQIDRAANPVIIPGLRPGEHEIELVVEGSNDQPAEGIDGVTISFTVLPPLPVRLHLGSCDDLDEDPVAFLNNIESRFQPGEDEAEEMLPVGAEGFNSVEVSDTRLELPMAVILGEPHALVVYAPGAELDDETEADEVVACGAIGGGAFSGDLRVALTPQNESETFGMALVRDEGSRTRVRIEFYRDAVEAVATPQPTATATPEVTSTPAPTATADVIGGNPTVIAPPPPLPTVPPPPPAPSNTPIPPAPTSTPIPPAPTNTPVPPAPTNTPVPPAATDTPIPPAPTNTPVPPPPATETPVQVPTEVVETPEV